MTKWKYTRESTATDLEDLGFDVEDLPEWRKKFKNLRDNAKLRGAKCLLSFRQYMSLAKRAGLESPDEVGKFSGQYCVGRKGDRGDYVWGNCRFITKEQNLMEREENGGNAEIGRKNSAIARAKRVSSWMSAP